MQRAATHVQRPVRHTGPTAVRDFGLIRFKESGSGWVDLPEGLGKDDEPQTVVIIALENLTPDNGFFLELRCGQDICVDGKASIDVPSTGGGTAVWIVLDL